MSTPLKELIKRKKEAAKEAYMECRNCFHRFPIYPRKMSCVKCGSPKIVIGYPWNYRETAKEIVEEFRALYE